METAGKKDKIKNRLLNNVQATGFADIGLLL
jgi:hypothetical protein